MRPKKGYNTKKAAANFFGSFGYLFCCLQWVWAIILYIGTFQSMGFLEPSAADRQVEQAPHFNFALPGPLEVTLVVAVTVIMVGITAYALTRMPVGIVKTSTKVVHKTAEAVTPAVIRAQHKKDTKRIRTIITARLMFVIKVLLVVIPGMATAASGLLEEQSIAYSIALIIGSGLAVLAVVSFAAQYALAGLLRTKLADLW